MPPTREPRPTNGANGGVSVAPGESSSSPSSRSLRSLTSDLLLRQQFALASDLTFDGARNVNQSLGYARKLTTKHYRDRYERGGIAERIIELFANSTWVEGIEVIEDPDPESLPPFEEAVLDLFSRLDVWNKLLRADISAALGRYSILLIGAPGALNTELPRMTSADSVIYLTLRAEDRAVIGKEVEDENDKRFGLPLTYKVNLGSSKRSQSQSREVHWTRVIHIAEGLLEDDVYGKPRLRSIWNYLDDLLKITGGGSEASFKRMDPGMQVDVPLFGPDGKVIKFGADEQAGLEDQIKDFQNSLRRTLYTRGVNIAQLAASVASFGGNADSILQLISGTTGIPFRILVGSERGELASTQDRNNWNDRIAERRGKFAAPLVRQFIDRLIDRGALPKPADGYQVVWPEIDELDEKDKSSVASSISTANKNQKLAEGRIILTSDEIRSTVFGLGPLEDVTEDVEDDDTLSEDDIEDDSDELEEETEKRAARRSLTESFDLADSPADEPDWRSIHRAADSHRDSMTRLFLGLWSDISEQLDTSEMEGHLENKDLERAETLALRAVNDAESALLSVLPARLLSVLVDGGLAGLRSARSRGSWVLRGANKQSGLSLTDNSFRSNDIGVRDLAFTAFFDATNPRAISWAATRSSALVTEIGPDTRTALRSLIREGIQSGIPPRKLRQQIRQSVGLRSDQLKAVSNLRTRLASARPGSLVRAGKTRIRVPKTGASRSFIDSRASQYATRLRNQRALLISRTETLRSANAGQKELWKQAQDSGSLPKDQRRVWIVTPDERLRDAHAEMDGQIVCIDESFNPAIEPGSEPNCRCAQGLE